MRISAPPGRFSVCRSRGLLQGFRRERPRAVRKDNFRTALGRTLPAQTDLGPKCASGSNRGPCDVEHLCGDGVLRALAVDDRPTWRSRLTCIALADPPLEREISFVSVSIDRLALDRGLGRDIEKNRDRWRRQVL